MGNLRACFAVALLALAACGSDHAKDVDASIKIPDASPDAKVFMDAPPPTYDFSCMGNTAPTMATAQITLSGTVRQVNFSGGLSIDPVDGATVDACKTGAMTCLNQNTYGTATTNANGDFSIGPINTNMSPLDAYAAMTHTNSRTVYEYPPAPFVADQAGIPVLTFSSDIIGFLPNCNQDDATNGMIALAVTDCANMPINDAANPVMLSIKQNNTEVTGTTVINLGQLNAQAAGTFLVCNVPEDPTTTVGATYKTMALRAHDVKVVKATTSSTILRPGY